MTWRRVRFKDMIIIDDASYLSPDVMEEVGYPKHCNERAVNLSCWSMMN